MKWVLARRRPNYVYKWEDDQPYRYFSNYPQIVPCYDILKAIRFESRRTAIEVKRGLYLTSDYVARKLPDWL